MRITGHITIVAALLALAVVAPATAAAKSNGVSTARAAIPANVPSANPGIDPAATPQTILASLQSLKQQSKKGASSRDLRNIAMYWTALTGRLTELGVDSPAPSSRLKQYV